MKRFKPYFLQQLAFVCFYYLNIACNMSIFKFSFKEGSNDKTSGCNTMKLFDIIASIELCNFVPILQTNANRYDYQNFEIYN